MKKAAFITDGNSKNPVSKNPWENMYFNNKSMELTPGDGLLCLRRGFALKKPVSSVTLRATALGIFDLYINGSRVGTKINGKTVYDELKPGWTDYRFRVFEYEYDITDMCGENNTLVAVVSRGWWSGRISFGFYGFKQCAFCGEAEIIYADGTSEIIASGEDWESCIGGNILAADIWDGEYKDAVLPDVWSNPDHYKWQKAIVTDDFKGEIVPLQGPPVRVYKTLVPLSAVVHKGTVDNGTDYGAIKVLRKLVGDGCEHMTLKAGESVILDMGQNMVGRPSVKIKAQKGTVIKGYVAEMLNDSGMESRGNDGPMGSMYIKNYRSALARVIYVAGGEGEEIYTPTHTFYGFRYFELTASGDIDIISVTGQVVGSDLKETASLVTSNAEINKLFSNIVWGHRGNYLSVPTDCPQRDERLGWTGDTQIFCGAASYLSDIDGFMHKWLADARDSQKGHDGAYCDVIPRVFSNSNNGNAAWAEAGLIVPYKMYLMYGDTSIIEENYDAMEDYMNYLSQFGYEGPNIAYGDWLNYEITDKRYIAVCYYSYDALLMQKFSHILGKKDREDYYRKLRSGILEYYKEKYTDGNEITVKTQTSYLLALSFDMLEPEMYQKTVKLLEKKIIDNNYTLSCGFVGTGILNQTLCKVGLDGLCYSLLLQTADPSWLYSVRQGATTIWERWNSYTIKTGFGDVGMNSFNHYAYGAVAEWMFGGMAGISPDPENPGFSHFILMPRPDTRKDSEIPEGQERIYSVAARYDSVKGRIESSWEYEKGEFVYRAAIPASTSARVEFPLINGKDNIKINGITYTAEELGGTIADGKLIFELAAGKYVIS